MSTALLVIAAAAAGELRWSAGAEVNASPHGIGDLGWRQGPWSVQLLTDTLDARYSAERPRGKVWGAARLEIGSAGLIGSAWSGGAPDRAASMLASYAGAEGGWQRYLPAGLYAGVEGFGRRYWFWPTDQTADLATPQTLLMGQAVLGWWRPTIQARLAAGSHLAPDSAIALLAPHLSAQVRWLPDRTLAPHLEAHAGVAHGQDFLSTTRLGGLNPYVVPLAGAGWAEWWVEDYAALRLGPALSGDRGRISAVLDAAVFDGSTAVGFGLPARLEWSRFFLEAAAGFAPWIPRQDGVGRWSALLLIGQGWG